LNLNKKIKKTLKEIFENENKYRTSIGKKTSKISKAVEFYVDSVKKNGRIFYVGAGTSGRIGALDAAEIPPTFGLKPSKVQSLIAGGEKAFYEAVEGSEDDSSDACEIVKKIKLQKKDLVIGLSASGSTPWTNVFLKKAKKTGCKTISIVNKENSKIKKNSDICIELPVQKEWLEGSTRMASGNITRSVLTAISTTSFTILGNVFERKMIKIKPTNKKLKNRAIETLSKITKINEKESEETLKLNGWNLEKSILVKKLKINPKEAKNLLKNKTLEEILQNE